MFELADEIGREHVRLLCAFANTKSVEDICDTGDDLNFAYIYCATGAVREGELTVDAIEDIILWANGNRIPYVHEDVLSKLEAIGFVASENRRLVSGGEQPGGTWEDLIWTCKVEVTARGRDFMSRKCLRFLLSLFPSKANKWIVGLLALAAIVGSVWSWVSNLAALVN